MAKLVFYLGLAILASFASAQAALYGQCGGIGWTGPTTCVSGTACVKVNDYYFQCLTGSTTSNAATTTSKASTTTSKASTTTTATKTTTTSSKASTSTSSSPVSTGTTLSQTGNPVGNWFTKAKTKWSTSLVDIILSYQQSNGGWPKNLDYATLSAGSGGSESGTIDNGATTTEAIYLAEIYKNGKVTKYRDAVRKATTYLLSAQYSTGGWPQFYPLKGGYADHVTFNDDAMVHVLALLDSAVKKISPFDTDVFTDSDRTKFKTAVDKGVAYILKAQWKQKGVLTSWCAQHGKDDYLPKAARAYELESLSGKESVFITAFLMTQPQTAAIQTAVRAALAWYRSPNTYLDGYTYVSGAISPIVPAAGKKMWYRFYNLDTNRGFFSDRDGGVYYDIMQISEERRTGYQWGGDYGTTISNYATSVGY
ncbi:hypothetical protein HK096_005284 [Nowakowskiella sp. JEL0078]|nr:hypothetical protein HK096_005284 [Nowakowskiella sp. JEL0078]